MKRRIHYFAILLCVAVLAFASCQKADPPVEEPQVEEPSQTRMVTITFHANDGTGETRSVTVSKSKYMGEPAWYPSKKGYTFAGWCTDEEGKNLFDFDATRPKTDMSLYASYSRDIILKHVGKIAQVTGNQVDKNIPSPNDTKKRWSVGGTDLGIIYEISEGKYGVFFGDTFENPNFSGDWRSNVLAYSENSDFENGLIFSGMYTDASRPTRAKSVIERNNYYSFTFIPTSAITINGTQYMHFMYWQVGDRSRDRENYSSFVKCSPAMGMWESCTSRIKFAYDSYFGMVGLAMREGEDYCYMMGTQTGPGYRNSVAKLARFKPEDILDETKYKYWNGTAGKWLEGEENATTVLDGTVGELSLLYMEKYGRWIVMYFDSEQYAICYRSAARLNGPWSEERILCSGWTPGFEQLYGSYMHPLCGKNGGDDIYWTMSLWGPYNVFWMKSTVSWAK